MPKTFKLRIKNGLRVLVNTVFVNINRISLSRSITKKVATPAGSRTPSCYFHHHKHLFGESFIFKNRLQ